MHLYTMSKSSGILLAYRFQQIFLKGRVHCFSLQVVMNKRFLLNPEKKFRADPSSRFREKRKKCTL